MCGCKHHYLKSAPCACTCESHKDARKVESEFVVGQQVSGSDYERLPVGSKVAYMDCPPLTKVAEDAWEGEDLSSYSHDHELRIPRTLTYLGDGTHAEPEDTDDVEPEPLKEGEDDKRIGAWERVADHPIFRPCYAEERPLIDAVMAKLDRIYSEGASPMRPEEPTILGAVVFSESHGKIWTRASNDPNEPFAWAGNRDRCWFNWRQLPDDVAVVDPKDLTRGGA